MFSRWLAAHRSLAVTATSGSLVAALVATAVFLSGGYAADRMDLNDASVWVANGSAKFIGRANTEILELNTVVASQSAEVDIAQDGATVVLFDRANATADIVDPATAEITDTVPLPPGKPELFLAGANVVVYSGTTGELWIRPAAALAGFDAEAEPTLNFGADTVISVDQNGLLFAFAPNGRQVSRVDAAGSMLLERTFETTLGVQQGARQGGQQGDYSVTSVGGAWAVLDTQAQQVETESGVIDLAAALDGGNNPVLQSPGGPARSIMIGYSGGLIRAPLGGGAAESVFAGASGVAAAPIRVGDCEFAAWSSGQSWRLCGSDDGQASVVDLVSMPQAARLRFQLNQSRLVLNDSRGGASWAVQQDGELIDNWDDLIQVKQDQQQVDENAQDIPPETEKNQLPPIALPDELGARPGKTSELPVLLNDYDPNGDVLVIDSVRAIAPDVGRIDIIENRQKLQLTLAPGAQGTVSFEYTISDGRGGSATASVRVAVRGATENSPPQQLRVTKTIVAAGGTVTVPVLGDWFDPDGDAFYLRSASASGTDSLSFTADGTVTFQDSSDDAGVRVVALVASDGMADGAGSMAITVRPRGEVPIIADPFVVLVYAGQPVTISPLAHVRGGTGTVRLNAVPTKPGFSITPSYETGSFVFSSDSVRTHYLEYVVTDDEQTATGIIRVDVAAPPDANSTPVTVPKTIFVTTLSSETIDVASTDIDPAGGVLLVTGVMNIPVASGVKAQVLEQRLVRVTLTAPLTRSVTFDYRITNGLSEANGTITVVEIPQPIRSQRPIARDDTAMVRVGDAITIDVLGNDEQPDGEPITLNPVLVEGLAGDSGLLFASGNTLRFLAPGHTGNFTAVYEISSPSGLTAQAELRIEVREPNVETNHAPVPPTVTARVLAGERVRIEIPLDGIDPDGDSVQLLGQETNPEKGGVIDVGTTFFTYEAGAYSAGTDTFTYTVLDALGARASGAIRVGISPKRDGARNPVAIEDEVRTRPGSTVSVQVLANDSDPDGSPLSVTAVEPNDATTVATIVDASIVTITTPTKPGRYGVVYTIENHLGGTSSSFVTVVVDENAPLAYPVATDTVLTLSDVLDRETVDVDVLQNVFFAEGDVQQLGLSVLPGYAASAEILANKKIRVTVGDESKIIPFAVSHPEDDSVRSYAFIWVPGFNDALPQLDRRAPLIEINSEDTIDINLNDYVIAVGGKKVRLTDSSTVQATHANGAEPVVDADTLRFTSADLYFGPASISFEVTDGSSATDPAGRTAILVLPIRVNPRENQPPVFTGAQIDFEPAQEKVIDLTNLTDYPHLEDVHELVFAILDTLPVDFTYELHGQLLTLRANENAHKGSTTAISLGVRDALNDGKAGRIQLQVVPSTRPLAIPVADNAVTKRGQTTVVDVLANDSATNPFPGKPLTVVAVSGLDGASLPAGMSIVTSANKGSLTVTVAGSAEPIDTNLQYQVADATGDPDRFVWGSIKISVQDVPDAPIKPARQSDTFVGGELKLRITGPQPNNSPITNYRVESSSHGSYSYDCGTTLICSLPNLTVGLEYRFQVVATNEIGDSLPSPLSEPYSIDYRPAAPGSVTANPSDPTVAPNGSSITVSWSPVSDPNPGTPVVGYTVVITGPNVNYSQSASSPLVTTAGGQLNPNVNYTVSVYARNSAQVTSSSDWKRTTTTVRTVGLPIPASPGPQAAINSDNGNGEIRVTWNASDPNGGGTVGYSIGRVAGSAGAPDCVAGPGKPDISVGNGAVNVTSGWVDTNTVDGESYTYFLFSDNGSYCSSIATGATESKRPPGAASGTASVAYSGDGQYDVRANGDLAASGIVAGYQFELDGDGQWNDVVGGQWLTSRADSSHYGTATTVRFRACRDGSTSYCGAASAASTLTPVNVRASVTSCVVGIVPQPAPPANSGAVSVSYAFSYNQPPVGAVDLWSAFTFSESDPVPADAIAIRVQATVTVGPDTYTDPAFGDDSCG